MKITSLLSASSTFLKFLQSYVSDVLKCRHFKLFSTNSFQIQTLDMTPATTS